MVCPKCGNEQADVFSQCQKCRHIFLAAGSATLPLAGYKASGASSNRVMIILGGLAGALLLGVILWWLNSPVGLPLEEGSYVNEEHQFGMVAPSDWMVLTKENYNELFEKLGGKFPPMLREGLAERRIEVGFMKVLENQSFSPSVNIVVMKADMPALSEEELAEGGRVISEGFRRMLDRYKMERSELVTVDELTSAQFASSGSLKAQVPSTEPQIEERTASGRPIRQTVPDEWKTFTLKFVQTLVPGKGRAYIVTSSALVEQYPEYQKQFDQIIESFRVLQRPSRFGPMMMGALNGGLAAALGYLLLMVFMNIVGLFRKDLPPIEAGPL